MSDILFNKYGIKGTLIGDIETSKTSNGNTYFKFTLEGKSGRKYFFNIFDTKVAEKCNITNITTGELLIVTCSRSDRWDKEKQREYTNYTVLDIDPLLKIGNENKNVNQEFNFSEPTPDLPDFNLLPN